MKISNYVGVAETGFAQTIPYTTVSDPKVVLRAAIINGLTRMRSHSERAGET